MHFIKATADINGMVRPFRKKVFRVYVKAQNVVYRNTTTTLLLFTVAVSIAFKFKSDLIRHKDKIFLDDPRQDDFY